MEPEDWSGQPRAGSWDPCIEVMLGWGETSTHNELNDLFAVLAKEEYCKAGLLGAAVSEASDSVTAQVLMSGW